MASPFNPHAAPAHPLPGDPGFHVVFVPVDGRIVFAVCVLLVFACFVWMCVLLHRGIEENKEV